MRYRYEKIFKEVLWYIVNYFDRKRLKNDKFSILCANCIGGVLYSRLNKPFLTPTINMWMEDTDLLRFVANIEKYMEVHKLIFIDSKYDYPVAKLEDITLYFNHCTTKEEAIADWSRRIERINKKNLFIILSDRMELTEEHIEMLENIQCKGKIVFTSNGKISKDYMLYLPYYEGCEKVGIYMIDRLKNRYGVAPFDGYFDYVTFFNTGKIVEYKGVKAKLLRKLGRRRNES